MIVEVLRVSNSERAAEHGIVLGQPGTISSTDPPIYVACPDQSKEWKG